MDSGASVALLDVAVNKRRQLGFGQGADLGGLDITVLEQHQGWDAADAVFWWRILVFVDVELGHFQATSVFLGDLIQDRGDHFAWAAPFSPVIDQHWDLRLQHFLLESGVAQMRNMFAHCEPLYEFVTDVGDGKSTMNAILAKNSLLVKRSSRHGYCLYDSV